MNNNSTATNTPSEPLLCKMGCGFFVSSFLICSVDFCRGTSFFRWKRDKVFFLIKYK
jgi:hypothetical protein